MTGFCSQWKLTLFGSQRSTAFNPNFSLYKNFIAMCSLPIHKTRSTATQQLVSEIKLCRVSFIKEDRLEAQSLTEDEQRMHDIAVLELAKLALKRWHIIRNEASTRVDLIYTYQCAVSDMQTRLIKIDHAFFMQHARATLDTKVWLSPLYNVSGLRAYLKTDEQKKLFDDLIKWLTENPENKKKSLNNTKAGKFCYAIFMPILNFAFDWDIIFDSFDACVNLASIF